MVIRAVLKLLRIKHWIKNGFVLAPLVFSLEFLHPESLIKAVVAFFSFCLMSSTVYVINDIIDRDRDRNHPKKKHRPIAAGRVSPGAAFVIAGTLLVCSVMLALVVHSSSLFILAIYLALNLLYSFVLKHMVIIDVIGIAMGFILRITMGAVAISVELSSWIIVTTFFISFFFGATKRYNELSTIDGSDDNRPVLGSYNIKFLNHLIIISLTLTIISYSLYTIDLVTVEKFRSRHLLYTIPFVVYGVFRYLYLVYVDGKGDDPAEIVLQDVPIIVDVILWLCAVVFILLQPRLF